MKTYNVTTPDGSAIAYDGNTVRLVGSTYGDGIRWMIDHALPTADAKALLAGRRVEADSFLAAAACLPRWPRPGELLRDHVQVAEPCE